MDARQPEAVVTTADLAVGLGLTEAAVRKSCRLGKLPGARREVVGDRLVWLIPASYADPAVYRAAVGTPGRQARTE